MTQDGSLRALLRAQITSASAEREASGIANSRHTNDRNRKIQIANHPPNDRELLIIFFTEDIHLWHQQINQLGYDRADAAKMSWPRGTTQAHGKRPFPHVNRSIAKIHFFCPWPEEQIHSGLATNFFILPLWPWILLEIRTGLKLQRIHKNADRNLAADTSLFSCNTD